jgi:hypothetical protein
LGEGEEMKKDVGLTKIKEYIYHFRGKAVMLDSDLASLYEIETKNLNKSVRRNINRFPEDFMFQITKAEYDSLRFQIGTLKRGQHSKYLPAVFTEHGILMLSSVLNSSRAIEVNIQIMRSFVQMRRYALSIVEFKRKIDGIEQKYDKQFKIVFDALRLLLEPPINENNKGMGFTADK